MAPSRQLKRLTLSMLLLLQILQSRRRRLREERIRRARARLERFRRFFQRQRSERALFIATLATFMGEVNPHIERRLWMVSRNSDWWEMHHSWSDAEWLENMRMPRSTFELICEELSDTLHKETTKMRSPIPVTKRVALTLWKLATNADYRTIEGIFGVAKSTICKILREVCEAIVSKFMDDYIYVPDSTKLREIATEFSSKWGIPQCVGAIDCTHVPIIAPSNNTFEYYNGNGWHSVMTQILVDSAFCIMDLHIGNTGSLQDSELFKSSQLFADGQDGLLFPDNARVINGVNVPYFVAADAAFPLLTWMMKPYPTDGKNITEQEKKFNQKLDCIHRVARQAMGRLKGRWHCLQTRNDGMVDFVMLIIQACCVLHNICEKRRHPFNPKWLVDDKPDMPVSHPHGEEDNSHDAEEIRKALVAYVAVDDDKTSC